jgi:hypothetical protein
MIYQLSSPPPDAIEFFEKMLLWYYLPMKNYVVSPMTFNSWHRLLIRLNDTSTSPKIQINAGYAAGSGHQYISNLCCEAGPGHPGARQMFVKAEFKLLKLNEPPSNLPPSSTSID